MKEAELKPYLLGYSEWLDADRKLIREPELINDFDQSTHSELVDQYLTSLR